MDSLHMKKEVLIAITLGLFVGLLITYGMYRVRSAVNRTPVAQLEETATDAAMLAENSTLITILNPEEGVILTERQLTVTGTTIPESHIVLFVNNTDYISTTDATGNFTFEVTLEDGTNVLTVHVVDAEGQTTSTERIVVVSNIFEQQAAKASPEATQSGTTE
jgi:hypothetical protein